VPPPTPIWSIQRASRRGRISSLIDSTRIVASIVFGRANRGLLAEAPCSGGGGCIACDRNAEEECFSTCGHQPTNGANWPEARTELAWWDGGSEC
jgi:hypothetical protein